MYQRYFKRLIDIIVSGMVLVLLSPVLLILTLLLCFFNKGAGVFFLQERPGYKGRPFKVIKFKTMNDRRGADGQLLPDKYRITAMGSFMRKSSLDELPQLLNVLKGDMSLIGPRPLLMRYLPLYSPEQARRHDVRPGISGWAQCHGRNNISWTEKFKLDVWYVGHVTFKTDISIVFSTLRTVLKWESTDDEYLSEVTPEPFNGHN